MCEWSEYMLNKNYLSAVKYPALVQFVVSFIVLCLNDPVIIPIFIVSHLISCALGQLFSYGCCWAFVLRKGKGQYHVWINYIVWILLLNLGTVAGMFGIA